MKIQQVRFMNLNSLVGEWKIDFTHSAFILDPIFAITGPTGAGKSTILDAICLALYGRTPRLNRVNKSGNEIMSRQTSECFAEVTFETQKGRYRSHWSQHRARKRADGEFQFPKHEISDADTGHIFKEKIRGVSEQIEAVTGMDFDRFTRSMLLAQGGLTAFLQANTDERAPILEQITGTEIYGQISIRVHERRNSERKRLDELLSEINNLQILDEKEEQLLNAELKHKSELDQNLARLILEKQKALLWLNHIAQMEEELVRIREQKSLLQAREEAFIPENKKLKLAILALELQGEYTGLISIRQQQEANLSERLEANKRLPSLQNEVHIAKENKEKNNKLLLLKKEEQKNLLPITRKVRELDLKIQERTRPIIKLEESIGEQKVQLRSLSIKQNNDREALVKNQGRLNLLSELLLESKADESLVEQLTGIKERCDTLKRLHTDHLKKVKEIKRIEEDVATANLNWDKVLKNQKVQSDRLKMCQEELINKQLELTKILENRSISDWRNDFYLLTKEKNLFEKNSDIYQSRLNSKEVLEKLEQNNHDLKNKISILREQLHLQVEKKDLLGKEVEELEKKLSSINLFREFEASRHLLQDGKPCPLCGANEHPFTKNQTLIPAPDKTIELLKQTRFNLKRVSEQVFKDQIKKAEMVKDLEQVEKEKRAHLEKIIQLEKQFFTNIKASDSDQCHFNEKWLQYQCESGENLSKLNHTKIVVEDAEKREKDLISLRDTVEKNREWGVQIDLELQKSSHLKEISEQLLQRTQVEKCHILVEKNKLLTILQKDFAGYGTNNKMTIIGHVDDINEIEKNYNSLIFLRDQYLQRKREQIELNQKNVVLELQTKQNTEKIAKLNSEIKENQDHLDQLKKEQNLLKQERQNTFGNKNPDTEEHQLATVLELMEKNADFASRKLNRADEELVKLKFKIAELDKSYTLRTPLLQSAEVNFVNRLNRVGLANEESFKSACLSEEKRKSLTERAQKLIDEKNELISREQEKKEKLEQEKEMKLTFQSREEIGSEVIQLSADQKKGQQEIGGIQQKLKDNDKQKMKMKERMHSIEIQKRETLRWDSLHELVGSSDGKKYRNFAQGLTFEMMVRHANQQLQKMTDRYLLICDRERPLELNVIDNYQSGEIRSTKNLSGGESFIVSLSLALGLSHMASKNVRVDSLFLDEGFGTLDEESLHTALETLASLQKEGKLIGVISHIPALKERISTQIQIIPQIGGRSVVRGPGCEYVNKAV